MAEEEVIATSVNPVPSNYKRKFEDLEPQPTDFIANSNPDAVVFDVAENKRHCLDGDLAVANANGHQEEQVDENEKETGERTNLESVVSEDGEPLSKDVSTGKG